MASNQTANFGLNQWAAEDQVLRTDFNADNEKIDAALAALGNCRITLGSYVGTGAAGSGSPNRIELDFKPMIVFMNTSHNYPDSNHMLWSRPGSSFSCPINSSVDYQVTWGDRSVQWYVSGSTAYITPSYQLNEEGVEYFYIALGVME